MPSGEIKCMRGRGEIKGEKKGANSVKGDK